MEERVAERASSSPRARYREQVRAEVRAHAWDQIAEAGASALSLKAIAKRMGMTAPALYRYFDGRDELLTELILTAYRELAEAAEGASAAGVTPQDRLRRLALTLRRWALSNPQRYLLLYGTPVPGYSAPPEATVLATRILAPVLAPFVAAEAGDPGGDQPVGVALRRSVTFWTRLHGVLSLELAGHFAGMGVDTEELYDQEIRSVIA
jgi:AcrR family transcriptional regulator